MRGRLTEIFVPSPFVARVDEKTCNACEVCLERCPVNAIEIDEFATVDPEVCLGCGVCVPTCKAEAVNLVRRSESEQAEIPAEMKKALN